MGMTKFWDKIENEYLVYKDEAIILMTECGVDPKFVELFKDTYQTYRSYPYEIMDFYSAHTDHPIEMKKEIPLFLLKVTQ